MSSNCEKCQKETPYTIPAEVCKSCTNTNNIRLEKTRSRLSTVFRVFYNGKIIGYIHDYTEYERGYSCEPSGSKSSAARYLGWNVDTRREAVKSLINARKKFIEKLQFV